MIDVGESGRYARISVVVCGFLLAANTAWSAAFTQKNVDVDPAWDRVRVFLDTKKEPRYKRVRYLSNPTRVQVDVGGRLSGIESGTTRYEDEFLRSISIEQVSKSRVRIVFTLAADTKGARVEYYKNSRQSFFHIDIPRPRRYQQPLWTPEGVERARSKGLPVVVLDAGHGGYDPGAISRVKRSLKEKDVVLEVSNEVVRILRKSGRVYPVTTRSGDYYPTLEERVDLVADTGAELFVSVHADSHASNFKASGFALWTCPYDKKSVKSGSKKLIRHDWRDHLARHPISKRSSMIRRQAKFVASETDVSAGTILASIDRGLHKSLPDFENRGIKKNNFKVLTHYFAPSVLIELGFLSNRSDARRLGKTWFRKKMALAIAKGIESYFADRSKRGYAKAPISPESRTWIATPKEDGSPAYRGETVLYVVRRGDTLAGLARRFGVTISQILSASQLPRKRRIIYVGEKLRIPVAKRLMSAPDQDDRGIETESYQVASADQNLLTIALRFGTTMNELSRLNGWPEPRNPEPGDMILVPGGGVTEVPDKTSNLQSGSASEQGPEEPPLRRDSPEAKGYEVRPRDTISEIADRFGMTSSDLLHSNGLKTDLIHVGQILNVPSDLDHPVKKGETLESIAKLYGSSVSEIRKLNNVKSDRIHPGDTLRIH